MTRFPLLPFLLAAGCLPKNTEAVLDRQAQSFDAEFSARTAAALLDERYLVTASDALAAAAATLVAPTRVTDDSAVSDWSYYGSYSIDPAGERVDQSRERVSLVVLPGTDCQVTTTRTVGQRTIVPGHVGEWSEASAAAGLPATIAAELQRIERLNLSSVSTEQPGAFLEDLRASLPAGFAVASENPGQALAAERITTQPRKKAPIGTWTIRETLSATVGIGRVELASALAYRFDAPHGAGDWHARPAAPTDALVDWSATAVRRAIEEQRVRLESHLPPALSVDRPPSTPPPVPRLRAMPEIRQIVSQRAYQTETGRFQVCLTHILVNPTSEGGDWDLPGAAAALGLLGIAAGTTARATDELNALLDAVPALGTAADDYLAMETGGWVDRRQIAEIARVTERVAGWTQQALPVNPDVQGQATVAGRTWAIPLAENSLHLAPNLCAVADFRGDGIAAQVQLIDVDLQQHDPIGQCTLALHEANSAGGSRCGWARVFLTAEFLFSQDQIAVVGLPPAAP
jgi:hypothetical protein